MIQSSTNRAISSHYGRNDERNVWKAVSQIFADVDKIIRAHQLQKLHSSCWKRNSEVAIKKSMSAAKSKKAVPRNASEEVEQSVLPQNRKELKGQGLNWREQLRDRTLRCPHCSRTWLILGAQKGAAYTCKSCAHRFIH